MSGRRRHGQRLSHPGVQRFASYTGSMATRLIDSRRLHVEAFAADHGALEGAEPATAFPRLIGSAHPEAPPEAAHAVHWRARGETAPAAQRRAAELAAPRGADRRCRWSASAASARSTTALDVDRWFRFVRRRGRRPRPLDDADRGRRAGPRPAASTCSALVEDELLMALPLVPRHERCPVPVPMSAGDRGCERAKPSRRTRSRRSAALKRRGNGGA